MRVLLGLLFAALLIAPASAAMRNRFCLERLEDQGAVNIYPVEVVVGKKKVAMLPAGGAKACVTVTTPTAVIQLRWHTFDWQRPDHGLGNPHMEYSDAVVVLPPRTDGGPRNAIRVCSSRFQGDPPEWHFEDHRRAPCP